MDGQGATAPAGAVLRGDTGRTDVLGAVPEL